MSTEDVIIYPVKEYSMTISDTVVKSELALQGFILIVKSLGYSPVSDVDIHMVYDIDSNTHKMVLYVRYIALPDFEVRAPVTTSAIHIRRPGVRLNPYATN